MSQLTSSLNAGQPTTSLERWLARRGLARNPFDRWNAEGDPDLPRYFVDLGGFDELLRQTGPCVVFARRGCGKTAQRQMLAAHYRPRHGDSPWLALTYAFDGFERALSRANDDVGHLRPLHHVQALLRVGIATLLDEAARDARVSDALASPDATSRLGAYAARFAPHLASTRPAGAANTLDELGSLALLRGFAALVREAGLASCAVLVDGLDEFPLTASDLGQAVPFLAPLLGTLPLIECPGLAFKFFLPQELEPALRACSWFRVDRLHILRIAWNEDNLSLLLGQRLAHASQRQPPYQGLGQLCEDALAQAITGELLALAGGLPRVALILANRLLQSHCQQPDPADLIALEAWQAVRRAWQERRADFVSELDAGMEPETAAPVPSPAALPVLRVDEARGLVWLGEREIRSEINPRDYSVLLCLYQHKSEVCSRDLIAQEAWPEEKNYDGISDQAIAASIARLRRVLKEFAPQGDYIETVRGKERTMGGYRLYPEGFQKSNSISKL
jgi:hypothetical protein